MANLNQASRHLQEPTVFSLTETVIDDVRRQTSTADSFYDDIANFPKPTSGRPYPSREGAATLDVHGCPPVIPPPPTDSTGRTLVLCFDGTGDQFDADNSNIVQLVSLLKKDDRSKQMVYYQTGVGTYTSPKMATPFMSGIHKTLDTMIASSIHAHVMSGYQFLMQNYLAGDKICIFGFSRGAYTARSLAGMLHKVGLLPKDNLEQLPFAYKMYTRTDSIGWEQSNEFKKAFSISVDIEFIGVWDTVDSVGIIPKRLPFTTSNTIVRTFRHALALDERRAKFKANLWNRPTAEEEKLGLPDPAIPPVQPLSRPTSIDDDMSVLYHDEKSTKKSKSKAGNTLTVKRDPKKPSTLRKEASDEKLLNTFERIYSAQDERKTDIEEVWFAGCHCDVGGGSVSNKTRHSLARIPLRWMVRECFKTNTGILFLSDRLHEVGIEPTMLYPAVKPRPPLLNVSNHQIRKHPKQEIPIRPQARLLKRGHKHEPPKAADPTSVSFLGSEEEEEVMDALSPVYDQLKIKRGWWILEILPLQLRYQRGDNQWVKYIASNFARPRFIPKQHSNGVKVHRSVKLRIEAEYEEERKRLKGKKYKPKARLNVEPIWID